MTPFPRWLPLEKLARIPHPPDAFGALDFAPLSANGYAFKLVLARCACCGRTYGFWQDMFCRSWGDIFYAALA
jgi:hypothetical protein